MNEKNLKIIIFDMDGLLVNTEKIYLDGWNYALDKYHLFIPPEVVYSWVGKGKNESILELDRYTGNHNLTLKIHNTRETYFFKELDKGNVLLKPYVQDILDRIRGKYEIGLATSTDEKKAKRILKKTELLEYFDYLVFGSDVINSKPSPDVYLEVLKRSRLGSKEALAVEDSIPGSSAAIQAGIDVIMIPDSDFILNREKIPSGVLKVCESLYDIIEMF